MDTLYEDSNPISHLSQILGAFATVLGGALLPVALLVMTIGWTQPENLTVLSGTGTITLLPLIGLAMTGLGFSLCYSADRQVPLSCWLGLVVNLIVLIALRVA